MANYLLEIFNDNEVTIYENKNIKKSYRLGDFNTLKSLYIDFSSDLFRFSNQNFDNNCIAINTVIKYYMDNLLSFKNDSQRSEIILLRNNINSKLINILDKENNENKLEKYLTIFDRNDPIKDFLEDKLNNIRQEIQESNLQLQKERKERMKRDALLSIGCVSGSDCPIVSSVVVNNDNSDVIDRYINKIGREYNMSSNVLKVAKKDKTPLVDNIRKGIAFIIKCYSLEGKKPTNDELKASFNRMFTTDGTFFDNINKFSPFDDSGPKLMELIEKFISDDSSMNNDIRKLLWSFDSVRNWVTSPKTSEPINEKGRPSLSVWNNFYELLFAIIKDIVKTDPKLKNLKFEDGKSSIKSLSISEFIVDDKSCFDWQRKLLDFVKNDISVICDGPTSGGKTYVSINVLSIMLQKIKDSRSNSAILFVTPSEPLCFQTYFNIKKTYPNVKVSILTHKLNDIKSDYQILIGTPYLLNIFLSEKISNKVKVTENTELYKEKILQEMRDVFQYKKQFKYAIFDEIHTLSPTYESTEEARNRSRAVSELLLTLDQDSLFVGLSATIPDVNLMIEYIKSVTRIPKIERVHYDRCDYGIIRGKRVKDSLPEKKVFILKEDEGEFESEEIFPNQYTKNNAPEVKKVDVNGRSLFHLLKTLFVDKKDLPAMVFLGDDNTVLKYYTETINFIKTIARENCPKWYSLHEDSLELVREFGVTMNAAKDAAGELSELLESEILMEKQSKDVERFRREIDKIKLDYINRIYSMMDVAIIDEISRLDDSTVVKNISIDEITKLEMRSLESILSNKKDLLDTIKDLEDENAMITEELYGLIIEYCYNSSKWLKNGLCDGEHPSYKFSPPDVTLPDFFKYETSSGEKTDFSVVLSEQYIDITKNIPLFELIIEGLKMGIGIVIPEVPVGVNLEIYNYLQRIQKKSEKADKMEIPFIFCAYEISMGVNFGVAMIIIIFDVLVSISKSIYDQASGRAGRPGFGQEVAKIYMLNVENAYTVQNDQDVFSYEQEEGKKAYYYSDIDIINAIVSLFEMMNEFVDDSTFEEKIADIYNEMSDRIKEINIEMKANMVKKIIKKDTSEEREEKRFNVRRAEVLTQCPKCYSTKTERYEALNANRKLTTQESCLNKECKHTIKIGRTAQMRDEKIEQRSEKILEILGAYSEMFPSYELSVNDFYQKLTAIQRMKKQLQELQIRFSGSNIINKYTTHLFYVLSEIEQRLQIEK